MKKIFTLLLGGFLLLSACEQSSPASTATKESPIPSLTATQTPNPSQTPDLTHTPRPTTTGTPQILVRTYPTKKVLVISGLAERTQSNMNLLLRGDFSFNPIIILYTDGQLIVHGQYEKQLSQKETGVVLTKLEQLGFFQIQDTYPIDEQNPLYTFPAGKAPYLLYPSSPAITITVNGQESKTVGYMGEWEKFLNQPLKAIVAYLDNLASNSKTRYQPNRVLVEIITEKQIPFGEDVQAIPWPEDVTPPSEMAIDGVLYLEGTEAVKIYNIVFEGGNFIFSYDGIKFQAYPRPIYPHECPIYQYQNPTAPPPQQQMFFCHEP